MTWASVVSTLRTLFVSDTGQDLIEYGLLMLLVAVVAVSSVKTLGDFLNTALWDPFAPLF